MGFPYLFPVPTTHTLVSTMQRFNLVSIIRRQFQGGEAEQKEAEVVSELIVDPA